MAFSDSSYASGTVSSLLDSPHVSPATRAVLQERLAPPTAPQFFDEGEFRTLEAICARLLPQPDRETPIPIASGIDERLQQNRSDGWRYDVMPPDRESYRDGLRALNEIARSESGATFVALTIEQQDDLLERVQNGIEWSGPNARLWFEELLHEATENYVAHPLAHEEMGYAGFADRPGWTKIELNEREDREPPENQPDWEVPAGSLSNGEVEEIQHAGSVFELLAGVEMKTYGTDEEVDVIVIGTGAGGAPVLARLAAAGLSVVALEAGRWFQPQRDFATDEKSQHPLFWNDERLSAGTHPTAFGNNNSGTGVGGSTLHYTAYVPRAQADDLKLRTEFGVGVDWPIDFSEIEPYYGEVEQFIGVSGPTPFPWGAPRSQGYPLGPLPLNGAAQLMARGCDALGIAYAPAANAALSAPYYRQGVGWRRACTNRGFCQAGCSTGAKSSMDVTYIPLALQHGAEIRAESFVTTLETDERGHIISVVYQQDGKTMRQKCRHVFLCAGAIETPRLLMLNNLCKAGGHLGHHFMTHPGLQLWANFEEATRPFKGIPGALISEETHRPNQFESMKQFGEVDFAGGYLLQSIGVMPVTYAVQRARGVREQGGGIWGEELREDIRRYNHVAGINVLGEGLPYDGNRMELSSETDVRGLPKPRVYHSAGDNERKLIAHSDRVMRAIFEAAGARDIWSLNRFAHIMGTCRMSSQSHDGVVNSEGRAWEVPNLWISDNSTFPSSLSCNPSLTIMALALRTADKFLARLNRNEA